MDKKDPQKRIGLLVDEWGTWWDEEPGTIKGHLYQQNTMRDAFVAALSLNVFHRHTDRVRMANIAQILNVLQSMILTDTKGTGHMVLTPTYHVFNMYKDFQNATFVPVDILCESVKVAHDWKKSIDPNNEKTYRTVPMISASVAKDEKGALIMSLSNISLDKSKELQINLASSAKKKVSAQILTCNDIKDYNDFDNPNRVSPKKFNDYQLKKDVLKITLPSKSIVVLKVE
jgi:alpha-N-arabinofuranosidase